MITWTVERAGVYATFAMVIFLLLGGLVGPWWVWWPLAAVAWAASSVLLDAALTRPGVSDEPAERDDDASSGALR